ncbi:MAG: hypothetical protein ACI4PE_02575 [Bacilli bacterium]
MKIKLKRTFRFKKVKNNMVIRKGASFLDDQYEYTTIKDSSLLSYMIVAAARNDLEICAFAISEYTEEGYVQVYGSKKDFINFIAEILEQFTDYISTCQL